MDRAAQEFNKASHALLDAEIRLRTVSIQTQQLEKEIAILTIVESNLEENIRILRRKRSIVIASEYRKATVDLNTARNRRAFLRIDRENCLKIEKHCKLLYEKTKLEYERAFSLLYSPPNNVIVGKFGKHGQT